MGLFCSPGPGNLIVIEENKNSKSGSLVQLPPSSSAWLRYRASSEPKFSKTLLESISAKPKLKPEHTKSEPSTTDLLIPEPSTPQPAAPELADCLPDPVMESEDYLPILVMESSNCPPLSVMVCKQHPKPCYGSPRFCSHFVCLGRGSTSQGCINPLEASLQSQNTQRVLGFACHNFLLADLRMGFRLILLLVI